MDTNTPFYDQVNFEFDSRLSSARDSDRSETSTRQFEHDYGRNVANDYDIDGQPFDLALSVNTLPSASSDYASSVNKGAEHAKSIRSWQSQSEGERNQSTLGGHYQKESPADYSYRGYDGQSSQQSLKSSRQDDRYSSKYNKDCGDDYNRRSRSRGYEHEHDRESQRSTSREHDRVQGDRHIARDWERSRDHEQRTRRHESGYDRDDSDRRSRRRSRSRDRDRSSRRYHHRDSDRERRRRDSDRDRPRRGDDGSYSEKDRGGDRDPKGIPWVPPPLPEHLRHLQVHQILNPPAATAAQVPASLGQQYQQQQQPPPPALEPYVIQNQFQNDGSFMEMFRQRMQHSTTTAQESCCAVEGPTPTVAGQGQAVAVASSSQEAALAAPAPAAPSLPATSSGVPVIAKRRISKILKTGVVQKKKKEEEEEESGKDGDGWSSYMKEVQRYRANKCIENEASRPPLVK